MFHFPLISQNELVLDQNKNIMPSGKIDILDPVSTNPIDVYTYDAANDKYVIATNPIILNAQSRAQHTYFVTQLAYCRLSKFLGATMNEFGVTAPQYEFVRDWYGSFDQEDAKNDTIINGIDGLRDANTDLGKVTVVGYWTDKDCEARTYVWDPQCTQDQDGGYIIKNNEKDNGRWILIFDGEYLPSTYYGVYPGRETQMNNLLNFVDTVGTAEKPTAKGIYFQPGVYNASTVALITHKKVLLDADTQFTRDSFEVADLKVIGKASHWICDFWIDNPDSEAHSSWFKSVPIFWRNGTNTLIIDKTNYFVNTAINSAQPLTNVTIIGNTRIPATYGENGTLRLNGCTIVGEKIFNSTDKIAFINTTINDSWWNVPADIDFQTKVFARSSGLNKLVIENFANTTAFVNALTADGRTELDLDGRVISGGFALPTTFNTFRNAKVEGTLAVHHTGLDVLFENVVAHDLIVSCRYFTANNCDISFEIQPSLMILLANNSMIGSQGIWTDRNMQIEMNKCSFSCNINRVTDNTTDEFGIYLTDCQIASNSRIVAKRLNMIRCTTDNAVIKLYPQKTNDTYYLHAYFEDCTFNNATAIEFTKVDPDEDCYNVIADWTIIGNTFNGNANGITCRLYSNRLGANWTRVFIKTHGQAEPRSNVKYFGNKGNCPKENMKGVYLDAMSQVNDPFWEYAETSKLYYFSNTVGGTDPVKYRMMPDLGKASLPFPACTLVDSSTMSIWCYKEGYNRSRELNAYGYLYPAYADKLDQITNGDLFNITPVTLGKFANDSEDSKKMIECI